MTTEPLGPVGQVSTDGSASDEARALTGGTPRRVGAFRFYFEDQRWEMVRAGAAHTRLSARHGHTTTELVLSHKHPDDRDQIAQTIDTIRRTGQPLSSRHRIVDTSGKVRSL